MRCLHQVASSTEAAQCCCLLTFIQPANMVLGW